MKRILVITCIVVLLLSGCYQGKPFEEPPEMEFLQEFFTINKDGRLDTLRETMLRGEEDYQTIVDAYHAGLAPYCEESALKEIEEANYLYLFDKSFTDFEDQWKTMELKASYRNEQWQHQDYRIVMRYPRVDSDIEITGTFDLNENRKISSFTIDTDVLPLGAGRFLDEFFENDRRGRYTAYCAGSQDRIALEKYHLTLSLYITEEMLSEIIDSESMIRFDRMCSEAGLTGENTFYISDSSYKNRHEYSAILIENSIGLMFSGTYTTDEEGMVDSFTIEYPEGPEKAVEALWHLQQEYNESCHNDGERSIVQEVIDEYIGDPMFYAHYADTPDAAIEMVTSLIDHKLGRTN